MAWRVAGGCLLTDFAYKPTLRAAPTLADARGDGVVSRGPRRGRTHAVRLFEKERDLGAHLNQSIASGLKDTSKPRFDEGVASGAAVKAGCPRHRRNARKNYVNSRYARNGGVRLEESTPSTRRPPRRTPR